MLIFTETKREASSFGNKSYAKFAVLTGDVSQSQRQSLLRAYRRPDSNLILVATDVAARGLDIDDIDVVVQYNVR